MLNFRILIAIAVAICADCFGQPGPLTCMSSGGVNVPVRAEGVAEPAGDLAVTCLGGVPTSLGTSIPTADIQITLNTQITSRLLGGIWSEALLLIDEPAPSTQRVCGSAGDTEPSPGVCTITGTGTGTGVYNGMVGRPNVFQATQTGPNTLLFTGIPIDPPAPGSIRTFRITNIRANVNALGVSSGNNAPTSVVATLSSAPSSVFPISGLGSQAVASVQLSLSARANVIPGGAFLLRNVSENAALAADPNSSGISQFSLQIRELFSTALEKRNLATTPASPGALVNQNDVTLGTFNTESNFYNNTFPIAGARGNLGLAGLADAGTRVMARFTQIPPGVQLFSKASAVTPDGTTLQMIQTDVNGAGPYNPVTGNAFGIAPLPVVNGAAMAVYEIVQSDPNSFANLDVPIYVAYDASIPANQPAVGMAILQFGYAPLSMVTDASTTEAVPRFADVMPTTYAFRIGIPSCLTAQPSVTSFGAFGGTGNITVTAPPDCNWTPYTASPSWITLPPFGSSGSASVGYTIASSDTTSARMATIFIYPENTSMPAYSFVVSQAGLPCTYTLTPGAKAFSAAGGTGSITVTPNLPQCPWTATTNSGFNYVTSGFSGTGTGTVGYAVMPNNDLSRAGGFTIGNRTFNITQQGPNVPSPMAVNSTSGSGAAKTFVFTFSDPEGWQDLGVVNILINRALDGRNACYLAYDRPSNVLYLVGDIGGGLTGRVLDGQGSVSNSQCTVNGAGSSASGSGNTLTLTLSLTFNQANFAGEKNTYLAARDTALNNSGWRTMGVWSVPRLAPAFPSIVSVTPSAGNGATQQFVITYRDATSSANLRTMQLLINSELNADLACYLGYDHASNVLYLVKDNNSGLLLPGIVPNSGAGTVENSQCTINGAGTTKSESGTDLTLTVSVTFKSSFAGPKLVYTGVQTISNANSDWHALGYWSVP